MWPKPSNTAPWTANFGHEAPARQHRAFHPQPFLRACSSPSTPQQGGPQELPEAYLAGAGGLRSCSTDVRYFESRSGLAPMRSK